MKKTFKWYMPENGETLSDAEPLSAECWDAEDAAEEAADLYYDACAGEWSTGDVRIVIVAEDGAETPFDVSVDYRPVFTARPVQTWRSP